MGQHVSCIERGPSPTVSGIPCVKPQKPERTGGIPLVSQLRLKREEARWIKLCKAGNLEELQVVEAKLLEKRLEFTGDSSKDPAAQRPSPSCEFLGKLLEARGKDGCTVRPMQHIHNQTTLNCCILPTTYNMRDRLLCVRVRTDTMAWYAIYFKRCGEGRDPTGEPRLE